MGIFRQFPYSNFHDMNMDQIIKIMREMQDEWAATKEEWASYKDFIDNYFANLDVSEEVLQALRTMAADGSLNTVIDPTIVAATTAWLLENITQPTDPVVDKSLTISGAAADAEVAGINIGSIRIGIVNNASVVPETPFNPVWEMGGFNASTGAENDATANYIRTINSLCIDNIDTIKITNDGVNNQGLSILRWDDISNTYLGRIQNQEILTAPGYSRNIDVSELTGYVRFSFKWSPTREMTTADGVYMPIKTTTPNGEHVADIDRDLGYTEGQLTITEKKNRIELPLTWAQGSVNTTNMYDEVNNLSNYIRSNIILAEAVDKINVGTDRTESYLVYVRSYDADGVQLSSQHKSITNTNILEFDISAATFIRLIISRTDNTLNVTPDIGEDFNANYRNQIVNHIETEFVKDNLMASFKRFAVIGDSLAAGHIYPDPDSTSGNYDDKSIAWGTYITRKLDNTYYNFSRAGMSADQFVTGIHAGDQQDLGDNKLACALDGNHNVPAYIINMGINNPNGLVLGTTADISLVNPAQNANSIIGWYARLVQEISLYYQSITQPVHIFLNVYGFMPANGTDPEERLRSAGRLMTWTKSIYDFLKETIESQGNYLHFIDLYSDYPETSREEIFLYDGAVIQKHWTSIGYNAIGMEVLKAINNYIWDNSEVFNRIEFIASNTYITQYNNPSNFT